jgi:hypothetical protein
LGVAVVVVVGEHGRRIRVEDQLELAGGAETRRKVGLRRGLLHQEEEEKAEQQEEPEHRQPEPNAVETDAQPMEGHVDTHHRYLGNEQRGQRQTGNTDPGAPDATLACCHPAADVGEYEGGEEDPECGPPAPCGETTPMERLHGNVGIPNRFLVERREGPG